MDIEKADRDSYINQVQTDVALISFLAVISVFFLGSLLSKFDSYDPSIKIPISFLIISTFSFIFSALILSNTSQELINGRFEKAKKHILYGYILSEYFGVYLFILSIPLAVNTITSNLYLDVVTFCSALAGLIFYQFMGFSVLENHFPKTYKTFSMFMILFAILLFETQLSKLFFTETAIAFLLLILIISYMAKKSK